MQKVFQILLLTLLALHTYAQTPILVSDPYKIRVTSPPSCYPFLQTFFTNYRANFLGYGAQWIWAVREKAPVPNLATFQATFMSTCPGAPTTLYITADDTFTAYLNDVPIGSGNDWRRAFSFVIKPKCGINTLKVITHDISGRYGLIFAIVQNQSNCYQCGPLAFYNTNYCKCECQKGCNCQRKLQKWADYPICGCACQNKAFTTCNLNTQFFNEASCKCQCLPKLCTSLQQQDPESCECRCKSQSCTQGQIWSYSKCACIKKVCPYVASCQLPKVWDLTSCSCKCSTKPDCLENLKYEDKSCSCVSLQFQQNINN